MLAATKVPDILPLEALPTPTPLAYMREIPVSAAVPSAEFCEAHINLIPDPIVAPAAVVKSEELPFIDIATPTAPVE